MWEKYGLAAISESVETELLWGGNRNQVGVLQAEGLVYSSAMLDAGATPTTAIRAGLLVAQETTSSELSEWDADATDGSQDLFGVVPVEFSTLDEFATAVDKIPPAPIVRAPLVAASLLIQGSAFVGHADEFLARQALHGMHCVLDDDPQGWLAGAVQRHARVTGTTDTLTTAENGKKIFYSNAASVTVTLPSAQPGLWYDLVREGDEEFVISSTNDQIHGDDLSGSTITFTTASEHIGAWVRVTGVYVNGTAKWQPQIMGVPIGVGLDAWTFGLT